MNKRAIVHPYGFLQRVLRQLKPCLQMIFNQRTRPHTIHREACSDWRSLKTAFPIWTIIQVIARRVML